MLKMSEPAKPTLKVLSIDTETTGPNPHRAKPILCSWSKGIEGVYESFATEDFKKLMEEVRKANLLVGQNFKYDAIVMATNGYSVLEFDYDTMLAEYLLHINLPRNLEDMYERYFGEPKKSLLDIFNETQVEAGFKARATLPEDFYMDRFGKPTKKDPQGRQIHRGVDRKKLKQYAQEDADAVPRIMVEQMKQFEKQPELYKWFKEVEVPVANILVKAELKGVKLDLKRVAELEVEVQKHTDKLKSKLLFLGGDPNLNINSTKQLQEVMYEKLKLPKLLETKTGWSTGKKALAKMQNRAFPKLLMEYNRHNKLLTSFLRPLPELVDSNHRLHTTFNQALTDTRRFSSEDPNLQNIPAKTELGRRIRACFVPESGYKFLVADYSQIEPRLLAHFSSDPFLLEAFNTDKDLYDFVAALMSKRLGRDFPRDMAKVLVLSLIYGKTAYGLAQDWRCSEPEAQEIIDLFYSLFTKVEQWMKDTIATSRMKKSWGKSIAGNPLYIVAKDKKGDVIGDLSDNRQWVREAAERCAVNYPIQSSSQDVIKKAMVDCYVVTRHVPVLFVHDEMVFELPDHECQLDDVESHASRILHLMQTAWKLAVPLKVSAKICDQWEK